MKDFLTDFKKQGKTVVFSTHVMEQAEKLCERIASSTAARSSSTGRSRRSSTPSATGCRCRRPSSPSPSSRRSSSRPSRNRASRPRRPKSCGRRGDEREALRRHPARVPPAGQDEGLLDLDVPDPVARPRSSSSSRCSCPGRSSRRARSASSTSRGASTTRSSPSRSAPRRRRRDREGEKTSPDGREPVEGRPSEATTRLELFRVEATPETLPEVRKRLNDDVQTEKIKAYIVSRRERRSRRAPPSGGPSRVKADVIMREQIAGCSRARRRRSA